MVQRVRRGRRRPGDEPEVRVTGHPGAATPADALLALQAGAGNQAVTRALQRFYEKPGAKRSEAPKNAKNKLKEGWVQNNRPPLDRILLEEGKQWYVWSQNAREWQATAAPAATAATAAGGEKPAKPPVKVPKPPIRLKPPEHAPIQDFESHSGLSLAASKDSPVEMPGGALPDKFVEMVFGHLDTSALLALRTATPWLLEHGSTALREHLHKQTKEHPKGRVGGTLSSMSTLGATPLVQQYTNAIKARPPEQLVVASDKVNAQTIDTLTRGLRGAVSVFYGERTDRGDDDPRYTHVKGPYDEGTHGGVKHSKMHNKLVVGGHEVPAPAPESPDEEPGDPTWKGDFMLSGSPNLTASAMGANIESAVLIRYPGIATLYHDYIENVKQRKTEDPEFTTALESFNRRNVVGIRAALAPFVDIGETLNAELQGADQITMRMFLVGSGEKHDTVGALCALAENPDAEVNVVVDAKEASRTTYVREALRRLRDAGVNVASEVGKEKTGRLNRGEDPRGIMHDKMILAHYPETETAAERWTVMIGSSGLTRNVDQNWNYENLLIIDDKALFESMQVHHEAAEAYRTEGIPAVDPSSPLGEACELLKRWVYVGDDDWEWAAVDDVLRARPYGMHPNVVHEAAKELGMVKKKWKGRDWYGFS